MPVTFPERLLFRITLCAAFLFLLVQSLPVRAADQLTAEILQLARQGDPEAQFSIGLRYDTGDGIERNPQEAAVWFKKAAAAGVAGACLYLGMKYEFGAGLTRDPARAIHWYEQAARQGWPQAAFLLGTLYLKSSPTQREKGCSWLRTAAAQGYPGAAEAQQGVCSASPATE